MSAILSRYDLNTESCSLIACVEKRYLPHMSDLQVPFSPWSPFGPGGPGSPTDPLDPRSPGGPRHTRVHANAGKYCDNFRIYLQTRSLSVFCIHE